MGFGMTSQFQKLTNNISRLSLSTMANVRRITKAKKVLWNISRKNHEKWFEKLPRHLWKLFHRQESSLFPHGQAWGLYLLREVSRIVSPSKSWLGGSMKIKYKSYWFRIEIYLEQSKRWEVIQDMPLDAAILSSVLFRPIVEDSQPVIKGIVRHVFYMK